jgi:RNA polymerase sigma-70 factor, ECF subfamily
MELAEFDRTYAEMHPRIVGFLVRLSGRRDTAEDLAQETWLKFARAAPTLPADTNVPAYLFTVARNAFISHRRWAMLDLSRIVMLGFESLGETAAPPDEEHDRARAIRVLEAALAKLPLASREVLLLVGVEGLEQDAVAKILGISYEALRKRLSRARAELHAKMEKVEAGGIA